MDNLDIPLKEVDFQVEQRESIKLTKNTKGYSWEIKILSLDIEKLDKLNQELIKRYSNIELKGGNINNGE